MQDTGYTEDFTVRDQPFWGKYPGVVMVPIDPELRGRMLVQVPDVWGPNVSSWAHPCVPWGGMSLGMYVIPAVGSNVWVEFMHGHPDHPIWTGFWWGKLTDPPPSTKLTAPGVPQLVMESLLKHAVVISDAPIAGLLPVGGILLRSGTSFIAIESTGIRIFGAPGVAINGAPSGDPLTAALYITV